MAYLALARFALNKMRYERFLRTGEAIVVAGVATYVVGKELEGAYNKLVRGSRKK